MIVRLWIEKYIAVEGKPLYFKRASLQLRAQSRLWLQWNKLSLLKMCHVILKGRIC